MTKLDIWIIEKDIPAMQRAMEAGELTAEELVEAYLERIRRVDPLINSVLEVNPDALDIARELDRERRDRGGRGMLHGIPVLLKDNIDTHDRMHTSAGSIALTDSIAPEDSFVAAKLREAGAVLLGKANMTEWANYMSYNMWAGYSSRGGQVLNPYGPGELFVGGSSSGSAASVAANLAAAAIGTETSGSIISPASQNQCVGMKPTVGLVSRYGIIPISHSQDSAGPITRTVRDTAILLGALAGADERDADTAASAGRTHPDYTVFLREDGLRGARIGIARGLLSGLDEERQAMFEEAVRVLREAGAEVVDPVSLPCEGTEWDPIVMRYDFKKDLNDYLSRLPESVPVHSLKEVIAFNERHADRALKYGQARMMDSEAVSGDMNDETYLASKRRNLELSRQKGIDHALEVHGLDALVFLGTEGGTDLAARAGYPVITVPAGYAETGGTSRWGYPTKGPQGFTFVGTAYSEPVLLRLAYGYEQATRHRKPPELL
ncbi:amidase family protein [Gorillibacterium sp. sgz5001074]|uniref:amidase family protein n=1 Tax=Gorillibacterium sp. sgz5001074 TaxID=3446695 RepID=UPI003F67DF01